MLMTTGRRGVSFPAAFLIHGVRARIGLQPPTWHTAAGLLRRQVTKKRKRRMKIKIMKRIKSKMKSKSRMARCDTGERHSAQAARRIRS
jgi:hypothetical protein